MQNNNFEVFKTNRQVNMKDTNSVNKVYQNNLDFRHNNIEPSYQKNIHLSSHPKIVHLI